LGQATRWRTSLCTQSCNFSNNRKHARWSQWWLAFWRGSYTNWRKLRER
jgi:hypothetical protein